MSGHVRRHVLSIAAGLASMVGMGAAFQAARAPVEGFSHVAQPFSRNRSRGGKPGKTKNRSNPAGTKFARLAAQGRVGIRPMGVVGKAIREMQRDNNLRRIKERQQSRNSSLVEQKVAA